jgi:hypothetical protein
MILISGGYNFLPAFPLMTAKQLTIHCSNAALHSENSLNC